MNGYRLNGTSYRDISEKLNVSLNQIYRYNKKYSTDDEVLDALFNFKFGAASTSKFDRFRNYYLARFVIIKLPKQFLFYKKLRYEYFESAKFFKLPQNKVDDCWDFIVEFLQMQMNYNT